MRLENYTYRYYLQLQSFWPCRKYSRVLTSENLFCSFRWEIESYDRNMTVNISRSFVVGALSLAAACQFAAVSTTLAGPVHGWLSWRGPDQNGTSLEKNLPDRIDANKPLWTADLPGQSTPVIANGHLYILGYVGEGPDLQEVIACLDAETGRPLWQQSYSDFLSDTIYHRYATSSPTIDPETGNVYMQGTQGILAAFTADGAKLWDLSMMEVYGRLTFSNGGTASLLIDRDLVITRGITAN